MTNWFSSSRMRSSSGVEVSSFLISAWADMDRLFLLLIYLLETVIIPPDDQRGGLRVAVVGVDPALELAPPGERDATPGPHEEARSGAPRVEALVVVKRGPEGQVVGNLEHLAGDRRLGRRVRERSR